MPILLVASIIFGMVIPNANYVTNYNNSTLILEAFSYYKTDDGAGHSWIAITNNTNDNFNVGHYYMESGEVVTVGLWGNLEDNGVWYNLESYLIKEKNFFNGRVSVSKTITKSELSTINTYVSEHDYWNVSYNCSCFVKDIWNLVSSDKLSCGWMVNLPAWLCDSINSKKPHYENNYIQPNEKIGYVKNGKFIEEILNKFDDSSNSSSFSLNNENEANTSFDCNNINIIIENQLKNNGIYMTAEEYLKNNKL